MKFYNIANMKTFVERMTTLCKGSVELINEDGLHLELTDGQMTADMIPLSYLDGSISQMEVIFHKPEDCVAMTNYIVSQKMAS